MGAIYIAIENCIRHSNNYYFDVIPLVNKLAMQWLESWQTNGQEWHTGPLGRVYAAWP